MNTLWQIKHQHMAIRERPTKQKEKISLTIAKDIRTTGVDKKRYYMKSTQKCMPT